MFEVRPAKSGDKDGVFAFLPEIWKEDYIQSFWDSWTKEKNGRTFVALIDGKHVGVIHVFVEGDYGWLEAIRVDPSHRRQHIGVSLTEEAMRYAKSLGARVVRLSTSSANIAAQNQVISLGFYEYARFARPKLEKVSKKKANARVASGDDLKAIMDFLKRSVSMELGKSLHAVDWRWKPLDEKALISLLRKKHILVSGKDKINGVLIFTDFSMWGDDICEMSFIDGVSKAIEDLINRLQTRAMKDGKVKIFGFVPPVPELMDSLSKAGMVFEGKEMIVYEKNL